MLYCTIVNLFDLKIVHCKSNKHAMVAHHALYYMHCITYIVLHALYYMHSITCIVSYNNAIFCHEQN